MYDGKEERGRMSTILVLLCSNAVCSDWLNWL